MASIKETMANKTVKAGREYLKEQTIDWKVSRVTPSADKDILAMIEELEQDNKWPFKSVSAEQLRDAIKPLMATVYDAERAARPDSELPADILVDRVAYQTFNLLDIVNQLDLEWMSTKAAHRADIAMTPELSNTHHTREMGLITSHMGEIFKLTKQELYGLNNRANDYLEPLCHKLGHSPIRLTDSNKDYFSITYAVQQTQQTTREHEEAYAAVIGRVKEIIKHGLPPETPLAQMIDDLFPKRNAIKQENEQVVQNLLSKEMDLDILKHVIIPAAKIEIAKRETARTVTDYNTHAKFGMRNFDSYRHQLLHRSITNPSHQINVRIARMKDEIAGCERAIEDLRKREAKMAPNIDITIKNLGNGNYSFTIAEGKGIKQEHEVQDGNTKRKQTRFVNYSQNSRTFDVGHLSQAIMAEKIKHTAMVRGIQTEITERDDKGDIKQKNTREMSVGERTYERSYKTGAARKLGGDKTEHRQKLKVNLARFAGKTVRNPNTKKEREIIGGEAKIGSITGDASWVTRDTWGTPKLSGAVELANVGANVMGLVDASYSVGAKASVGAQLNPDSLAKLMTKVTMDELMQGRAPNLTKIADAIQEVFEKTGPSITDNISSFKLSIAGIDTFKAAIEHANPEKTPQIQLNEDFVASYSFTSVEEAKDMWKTMADAQKSANEEQTQDENIAPSEPTNEVDMLIEETAPSEPSNEENNIVFDPSTGLYYDLETNIYYNEDGYAVNVDQGYNETEMGEYSQEEYETEYDEPEESQDYGPSMVD